MESIFSKATETKLYFHRTIKLVSTTGLGNDSRAQPQISPFEKPWILPCYVSDTLHAEETASADGRACSARRDLTHPAPRDIALPPLAVRQHIREKQKARWRLGVPW